MIQKINVRFLPDSISESDCDGCVVVMVDVLRASTTMIQSLSNGVMAIFPQAEIDASIKIAGELGQDALLGGERNGKILEGFDLGNSPREYSKEAVNGKPLVLCTTNGTYTLNFCRSADRILIGAFVNLSAVCEQVLRHKKLLIACAGTNRMITDEDILFAGALVSQLLGTHSELDLDDGARIAASRWQAIQPLIESGTELWEILAESHGGRNLKRLNYEHDIRFCANIDSHFVVPELDLETWSIRPSLAEKLS